jgi:maltokinase
MTVSPHAVEGAELDALLRGAPWMDEAGRVAGRYDVVDRADLDAMAILVVRSQDRPDIRYALAVGHDDAGRIIEFSGAEGFDRAVIEAVRGGRPLPTTSGGRIDVEGAPGVFRGSLPFAPGWSSNALSLIDLDGRAHVHKTYRRPHAGINEPAVLRLMSDTGYTTRCVGRYTYAEPHGGSQPLGVLYEYAHGEPLDAMLRGNLRSLWSAPESGPAAVVRHVRPLEPLLRRTGRFVCGFHDALRARVPTAVPFPVQSYCAEARERCALLIARIRADHDLPGSIRSAAVDGLTGALRAAAGGALASGVPAGFTGPCHGDLHLAHLLIAPDERRMRVIDVSTPAVGPGQDEFATQSPWQDLVSLQRALEYFTADEAVTEVARRTGTSEEEVSRQALLATAGADDTDLPAVVVQADRWRQRVLAVLVDAYAPDRAPATREPAWQLLYLRRLIHELIYNYSHDRPYFAAMDLRQAVRLA